MKNEFKIVHGRTAYIRSPVIAELVLSVTILPLPRARPMSIKTTILDIWLRIICALSNMKKPPNFDCVNFITLSKTLSIKAGGHINL